MEVNSVRKRYLRMNRKRGMRAATRAGVAGD